MKITIEELEKIEDRLLIDVRSPGEYQADHLPGAINLPVLDNEERARVGTIYNRESHFKARLIGAGLICKNIPAILDKIYEIHGDEPIIVYCWRGGQRSNSLTTVMKEIGFPVRRLAGGYKAYRKKVYNFFEEASWENPLITIYGLTGAGKTKLLHILKEKGESIVDLEGAANHRGSAFGSVGLGEQPTQEKFENRLYQQLQQSSGYIFVEGESRCVGQRAIPETFFKAMKKSYSVWLKTPLQKRVKIILSEYNWPQAREKLIESTENLRRRLGNKTVDDLQEKLKNNRVEPVIKTLLEKYYDPAYRNSLPEDKKYDLVIDGNLLEDTAQKLISRRKKLTQAPGRR